MTTWVIMGTKKRRRAGKQEQDGDESGRSKRGLTTALNNLHAMTLQSKLTSSDITDANQMMANSFQRNIEDIERVIGMPAGNTGKCVPSGDAFDSGEVTPVTRAWEERFLHEAYGNERSCAAGAEPNGCWANRIFTNAKAYSAPRAALTLVEFYTPSEYKLVEETGWKWPEERRTCLLCLRVATHRLFVQRRASNIAAPSGFHYAKISNLTGIAGEYHLADCFVSAPDRFEGLVDPVVIPRLTDYDVGVVNGVRCVRQKHGTPAHNFDARAMTTTVLDFRP